MLKQAGLAASTSEALRLIEQGGVRIDGTVISDKGLKLDAGTRRRAGRQAQVRAHRAVLNRRAHVDTVQVSAYLKLSIAVAVATITLKTGAWWVTGSVSLLSDAMESVVNLAGAMFALAMVTVAARPPDDDHPFGHHKAEYFSSGFEGVLIFIAALAIVWAAVQRLWAPQPIESLGLGLTLSMVSSVLNGALAWSMLKKAREHRSMALEGDARHLFTDVWTSVGVVLGLLAVAATGWLWLDPVMAIAGGRQHRARGRSR